MGKLKRMDQVKAIIKTYIATQSLKATARQLRISKNTVKEYVHQGQSVQSDLSKLLDLSDEEFLIVFYGDKNKSDNERTAIFLSKIKNWIKELRKVGVTKHLLWQEYRTDYPTGFGYSRFCELFRNHIGQSNLTLPMHHPPGEVMQVDYTGKKLQWVDIHTGEVHQCEVLVAVIYLPPKLDPVVKFKTIHLQIVKKQLTDEKTKKKVYKRFQTSSNFRST